MVSPGCRCARAGDYLVIAVRKRRVHLPLACCDKLTTLILTNTYFLLSPSQATVMVQDTDDLSTLLAVAAANVPNGIDYHTNSNALIVSVNNPTGSPNNFQRIATNGATSAWSTLSDMGNLFAEIKLTTVKVTTNGWATGDMYFNTAQAGTIGRISADGSSVNTNWATLPGETNLLRSLYIDQSGVWSGDLIAVTGGNPNSSGGGGAVWRVTSAASATKVAQINDANGNGILLEGVLTVPNDPAKYGPWAGRILTCAEPTGMICAVDTNGTVTVYNLGLGTPEDVRLIPSGQNLYCLDFSNYHVLKVTADNFAGFAGDVLLVDEAQGCALAGVYVVHWTGGGFVVRQIPIGVVMEHVVFAPINIPALP